MFNGAKKRPEGRSISISSSLMPSGHSIVLLSLLSHTLSIYKRNYFVFHFLSVLIPKLAVFRLANFVVIGLAC